LRPGDEERRADRLYAVTEYVLAVLSRLRVFDFSASFVSVFPIYLVLRPVAICGLKRRSLDPCSRSGPGFSLSLGERGRGRVLNLGWEVHSAFELAADGGAEMADIPRSPRRCRVQRGHPEVRQVLERGATAPLSEGGARTTLRLDCSPRAILGKVVLWRHRPWHLPDEEPLAAALAGRPRISRQLPRAAPASRGCPGLVCSAPSARDLGGMPPPLRRILAPRSGYEECPNSSPLSLGEGGGVRANWLRNKTSSRDLVCARRKVRIDQLLSTIVSIRPELNRRKRRKRRRWPALFISVSSVTFC
jgi:hypothetical protein